MDDSSIAEEEWRGKAISLSAVIGRRIQSDVAGQDDRIKQAYMAAFLRELADWIDPTWPFSPDWRDSIPKRRKKAYREARP